MDDRALPQWTSGELPHSEKVRLDALANHLAPDRPAIDLYFFARSGFAGQLLAEATRDPRIHLVTPRDLV
jgi:hypothetical protein